MSLKILFPLRSVLLQRYLKLTKYPCVPLYFPATPEVRQDHVTSELSHRRLGLSPHVLASPAIIIIGLSVEMTELVDGISLDPCGTLCKEAALERQWTLCRQK